MNKNKLILNVIKNISIVALYTKYLHETNAILISLEYFINYLQH